MIRGDAPQPVRAGLNSLESMQRRNAPHHPDHKITIRGARALWRNPPDNSTILARDWGLAATDGCPITNKNNSEEET